MIKKLFKNKISNKHFLIFDLDGTLINTDEVNFFSYKEAIQKVKKLDLALLYKSEERFTRESLNSIIGNLSNQEYISIIEIKNDVYHKYLHKSEVNHHILNIIVKFSQTNQIVLATSSQKIRATMILEYHSLKNNFDHKFYKENYKSNNKFLHVLDSLDIYPNLAIIFENDSNEIKKAILSGIPEANIINIINTRIEI